MSEPYNLHDEMGRRAERRSPWRFVADLFSNVWLGIFLAAMLFVYCSVGSAMPTVRQHAALDMTECRLL